MLPMSNYRNIGSVTIKGFEVESFYDSTYVFGSLSYAWMTGVRFLDRITLNIRMALASNCEFILQLSLSGGLKPAR